MARYRFLRGTIRSRGVTQSAVSSSLSPCIHSFLLRRKLIVEPGKSVVRIKERISNRGEEDMHFMWGHHPAFGSPFLEGDCHIQIPGATFQAHDVEISPLSRIGAGNGRSMARDPRQSRDR